MSLTVKESGEFKSVSPGTYPARCIRVIDIGTQHGEYQGKAIIRKQILVTWELPEELIADGEYAGQPYVITKFYTASLSEKANLRKDLEAWRGKAFTQQELEGFSLKNIIGKPCLISVIHSEQGRAKVGAVMALSKGMKVAENINPLIQFDISDWDANVYENLTDGIKKLIQQSDECKNGNQQIDNTPDDNNGEMEPF